MINDNTANQLITSLHELLRLIESVAISKPRIIVGFRKDGKTEEQAREDYYSVLRRHQTAADETIRELKKFSEFK